MFVVERYAVDKVGFLPRDRWAAVGIAGCIAEPVQLPFRAGNAVKAVIKQPQLLTVRNVYTRCSARKDKRYNIS